MSPSTTKSNNVIPFEAHRADLEPDGFAAASKAWLWRWHTDRRLTLAEGKICVCLYMHFNTKHFIETGELKAWPSQETIIADTGLERSCVQNGLRRLGQLGAFKTVRGPYNHKENRRGHNEYIAGRSKAHVDGPNGGDRPTLGGARPTGTAE